MQASDIDTTAELLMRFVSQLRRKAAQYMAPGENPFQLAYIDSLGRLSSADRSDLARIIKQMLRDD